MKAITFRALFTLVFVAAQNPALAQIDEDQLGI